MTNPDFYPTTEATKPEFADAFGHEVEDTLEVSSVDMAEPGFLKKRLTQISDAKSLFNDALDKRFGKDISGVKVPGSVWLKARFNPTQLKINALNNLGMTERISLDGGGMITNPVLRDELYRQAADGGEDAHTYISRHDSNYGQCEGTTSEAAKEALSIFSGLALVYRIGATALTSAAIAEAALEKDELKKQEKFAFVEKKIEERAVMFGTKKAASRKNAYKTVASMHRRSADPFDRR